MIRTCIAAALFALSLTGAAMAQTSPTPAPLPATAADPTTAPVDAVARWLAAPTVPLDAREVDLAAFQWIARPVLVFADSPNDPQFVQQMELLAERADDLALRDVVVIFDTAPADRSAIRLRARPRGFMLSLIGKDGQIKARKPSPWTVRELSRSIDKMPMRQQEMQDRRGVDQ